MSPRAILMLVAYLEMAVVLGGAVRYSGMYLEARLAAPGGPSRGGNSHNWMERVEFGPDPDSTPIAGAKAGPNPGGNSRKLMESAESGSNPGGNSVAGAKAGPNPGGNSRKLMESAKFGPNPGGNSIAVGVAGSNPGGNSNVEFEPNPGTNSIARAKAGPNPGGNSQNLTEEEELGPNPGGNSVAVAKAGPNPGGNSLGGRKNAQQFRMSRPHAGHANMEGRLFSRDRETVKQLSKDVLSFKPSIPLDIHNNTEEQNKPRLRGADENAPRLFMHRSLWPFLFP